MSSGQNPFGWAFSYDTLRRISEKNYPGHSGENDVENGLVDDKGIRQVIKVTRPPTLAIMGWFVLRVVLGIDMAILFELVGGFVLRAVDYDGKGMTDHCNPLYTTLAGCVGGAISSVLLIIIDFFVSKKESKKEKKDRRDAYLKARGYDLEKNSTGVAKPKGGRNQPGPATQAPDRNVYPIYGREPKPYKTAGETEAQFKARQTEWEEMDKRYAGTMPTRRNLYEEWPHPDGKLRLVNVRYHALMRLLVWPLLSAVSGATGAIFWDVHRDRANSDATGARVATGVLVQVVGMAVAVVGPTLLQIVALSAEFGDQQIKRRKYRKDQTR